MLITPFVIVVMAMLGALVLFVLLRIVSGERPKRHRFRSAFVSNLLVLALGYGLIHVPYFGWLLSLLATFVIIFAVYELKFWRGLGVGLLYWIFLAGLVLLVLIPMQVFSIVF